jgi:hypothetical protein
MLMVQDSQNPWRWTSAGQRVSVDEEDVIDLSSGRAR